MKVLWRLCSLHIKLLDLRLSASSAGHAAQVKSDCFPKGCGKLSKTTWKAFNSRFWKAFRKLSKSFPKAFRKLSKKHVWGEKFKWGRNAFRNAFRNACEIPVGKLSRNAFFYHCMLFGMHSKYLRKAFLECLFLSLHAFWNAIWNAFQRTASPAARDTSFFFGLLNRFDVLPTSEGDIQKWGNVSFDPQLPRIITHTRWRWQNSLTMEY